MHVSGREIALAIDDTGAKYPVTIDPTFGDKQFHLKAIDGTASDNFGISVAISGDTAVVGAFEDDEGGGHQGSAYVFVRSGTMWIQQQKLLQDDDASAGDRFGVAVAISGDTIVVGAQGVDFDNAGGGVDADMGAAYVYTRTGSTWSLPPQILIPSDGRAGMAFGHSVAISGDTIVVGINSAAAEAYVFVRSGGVWSPQTVLTGDNPVNQGGFGGTVAISGNTAMVAGNDGVTARGAVFFFVRNNASWNLQQKVLADDHVAGDVFGFESIAISGETAIVGYHHSSPNAGLRHSRQGAYVYVRNAGNWFQQDLLTPGKALPTSGFINRPAVAISGDTAIVGFSHDDPDGKPARGSAHVYLRTGDAWRYFEKLIAGDGAENDEFGFAVALSGDNAVIGAHFDDVGLNANQGSAQLFARPPDTDGDALPDEWEKSGITVDPAGKVVGTGNLVGQGTYINLKEMGANPMHKDIFVHADWMQPIPSQTPTVVFKPNARTIQTVIDAFAVAPVVNPDLKIGINIHIDLGPDSIMRPRKKWGMQLSKAGEVPFQPVGRCAGLTCLGIDGVQVAQVRSGRPCRVCPLRPVRQRLCRRQREQRRFAGCSSRRFPGHPRTLSQARRHSGSTARDVHARVGTQPGTRSRRQRPHQQQAQLHERHELFVPVQWIDPRQRAEPIRLFRVPAPRR